MEKNFWGGAEKFLEQPNELPWREVGREACFRLENGKQKMLLKRLVRNCKSRSYPSFGVPGTSTSPKLENTHRFNNELPKKWIQFNERFHETTWKMSQK